MTEIAGKAKIEFTVDSTGQGKILLNDEDISYMVNGLKLDVKPNELARVWIGLVPTSIRVVDESAVVGVDVGIDWNDAPSWANYAAIDKYGYILFFQDEPQVTELGWGRVSGLWATTFRASNFPAWKMTFTRRPDRGQNDETTTVDTDRENAA